MQMAEINQIIIIKIEVHEGNLNVKLISKREMKIQIEIYGYKDH